MLYKNNDNICFQVTMSKGHSQCHQTTTLIFVFNTTHGRNVIALGSKIRSSTIGPWCPYNAYLSKCFMVLVQLLFKNKKLGHKVTVNVIERQYDTCFQHCAHGPKSIAAAL